MEFYKYLLPLCCVFPFITYKFTPSLFNSRKNLLPFLNSLILAYLTIWTFMSKTPQELIFANFFTTFNLSLKLDVFSGLIATTVSIIGTVVLRFSVRYMEDDPKKERFLSQLSYTISCVLVMLMTTNMATFFMSWAGTSYFLHQLLTHYYDRPEAVKAANQKFWISRLGDLFILTGSLIILWKFNSLEFNVIFESIKDPIFRDKNQWFLNLTAVLIVLGSMTKSAQYPFHYWLPNTMEAPTPVSALMHAGIINAGGYLVIRMSPLLSVSPIALSILALVGAFTAFFSSFVMLTQSNIKKSLAYSTISQMGFMMLQCGLGAFYMAAAHIVGHAFYKAYGFLSAGTAADMGRLNRYFPRSKQSQNFWITILTPVLAFSLILFSLFYFDYQIHEKSGVLVLFVILSLALSQIFISLQNKLRAGLNILGITALYFSLSLGMNHFLSEVIPSSVSNESVLRSITIVTCSFLFIVLYLVQNNLEKISETQIGKKLYIKALKGGI